MLAETVGNLGSSGGPTPDGPPWWFFLLFPVMVVAVPALIGLLGGWSGLAERFATREPPVGVTFEGQSVSITLLGNYKSVVKVTVGPVGVHLVPMLLLRLGHRPLLIPWTSIAECTEFGSSFWKKTIVVLCDHGGSIGIGGDSGAAILRAWQERRVVPHV